MFKSLMDHQYGGIPKRLKGSVLKTDSGLNTQPGSESLFLRQVEIDTEKSVFFCFLLKQYNVNLDGKSRKKEPDLTPGLFREQKRKLVELWTSGNKGFACFICFVFDEVLLEARSKVFGLFVPSRNIGIGIARI